MRLFYDAYTSAKRGDVLLLAADCIAIIAAVFFATGAPFHANESIWDVVLLGVWAVIPRNIAKFLGWFGRPRDFILSFSLSLAFVGLVTLLLVAGWEILLLTMSSAQPMREGTAVLLMVTWISGFLLCYSRSYRLHDFLLLSVVLLALLQRMPAPYLWLPLFLLGMFLSAAARHILFDVFPGARLARINLQNVRALALIFTLAAIGLFAAAYQALYPLLDAQREADALRTGRGTNWFSWGRADTENSSSWSNLFGSRGTERHTEYVESTTNAGEEGFMAGTSLPSEFAASAEMAQGSGDRRIAFTYSVRLQDLATPRLDARKVFSVAFDAPPGEERTATRWRPDGYSLWKVTTLSSFDPLTSSWLESASYVRDEWNAAGRYELASENAGLWNRGAAAIWLRVDVHRPVFRNLVAPYAPLELGPVRGSGRSGETGEEPSFFLRNPFGDIMPYPTIQADTSYYARVRPAWHRGALPPPGENGAHPNPLYLEIPSADVALIDLEKLAVKIFGNARTIREKVIRLQDHFRNEFHRSNATTWQGNQDHLQRFLLIEKVGDCTYFSTASALLLRAAGVSTRLAIGFVGCEDAGDGTYTVRNMNAHGWIEVFLPNYGWFPLDPTPWAPPSAIDPSVFQEPALDPNNPFDLGASQDLGNGNTRSGTSRDPSELGALEPLERELDPRDGPTDPEEPPQFELTQDNDPNQDFGGFSSIFPDDLFHGRAPSDADVDEGGGTANNRAKAPPPPPKPKIDKEETQRLLRSAIVRTLLVTLGAAALVLVVVAYLRPRRKEEDDDVEDDAEDAENLKPLGLDEDPLDEWRPANAEEEVLYEYHRMQLELSRTRSHRRPHQTPVEHGRRFRGRNRELDGAFSLLHRILYAVLYGRNRASSSEVGEVRQQCRTIRKHLS